MLEKINLSENFVISKYIHGFWRAMDWKMSKTEILNLIEKLLECGISTFDHADIYGNYECEKLFGNALNLKKSLINDIQIITKCGIKIATDKNPHRNIKTYDYSSKHIIKSVENSLNYLQTDHIDLLLLHRPAPFFNHYEVKETFEKLKKSGKVLNFGVSNFYPREFENLNKILGNKLITNQIEISPLCLDHFDNGNLDYLTSNSIKPLSWSPVAGGRLFTPKTEQEIRVQRVILEIAEELDTTIDKVIYAWLLKHPAGIIPILGSGKIERIKSAIESEKIEISMEHWYKIYIASKGKELP